MAIPTVDLKPAEFSRTGAAVISLSGQWTVHGLGDVLRRLSAIPRASNSDWTIDARSIVALDTVGAWVLHTVVEIFRQRGCRVRLEGLIPKFATVIGLVEQPFTEMPTNIGLVKRPHPSALERLGRGTVALSKQSVEISHFIGESTITLATWVTHPHRVRWRPILFNIRTAGFDALPIVGLLSFLIGVVVAYQGAGQLRQYGASIYIADLIGLSILREFAPLMTAIIVAGRSGSAYAAQIGTMAVTEEIDALRTIGIEPLSLLVLPKVIALLIALPLLTVFSDVAGVIGGMVMAHQQLDVGYTEFVDRFVQAVSLSSYAIGIGKAPVFAIIIVMVGCFQGFRTRGGADSVGQQTTRSVVQSIFLVIVADALFSVVFSALDL